MNDTPSSSTPPMDPHSERNWAMFCHLSALCAFIGIPLGHILGPLVCWLMKKEQSALVNEAGKESLNFQISMTIYILISLVLVFILIGIPLLIILGIADLILTIVAAVKVSGGKSYRYPLTIRFLK